MRHVLGLMLLGSACGFSAVEERRVEPAPTTLTVTQKRSEPTLPQSGTFERVMKDQTSSAQLTLDETTVFCSALGYGLSFLKVSVPALDELAHFDHRVSALGLPCAAAGACTDTFGPDSILQGRPGVEQVSIRVVLTEVLRFDAAAGSCTRQLQETVTTSVRDVPLRHHAEDEPVSVPVERCLVVAFER
ncbi:MAG: hypothetical protein ABTQ32_40560 [Myxococcaceae bacterium]